MSSNDTNDIFLQKLRNTFRIEAEEHVQAISSALLALEGKHGNTVTQVEAAFRHFHSLKGAARAVNIFQIEKLCQVSESILEHWKNSGIIPHDQNIFDSLHAVINGILIAIPDAKGNVQPIASLQMKELLAPFDHQSSLEPKALMQQVDPLLSATQEFSGDLSPSRSSVRVPTEKLDELLTQAEELLAVKMSWCGREIELKDLSSTFHQWEKKWSKVQPLASFAEKDVSTSHAHILTNTMQIPVAGTVALPGHEIWDFLDWNVKFMRAAQEKLRSLMDATSKDTQIASRLVDDLLLISKQLLMLPFSTIADVIPKLIRDLSRDQGKGVELVLLGTDMEIDKRILEELKDPLIHLLRNCVDHGIESPEVRVQSGKSPHAQITIQAIRTSNNTAEIIVSDNGAGISVDSIKAAALERGFISTVEASQMTEDKAQSLIFRPGFSTSSSVTEISGRGIGLAVVHQAIQKLGGRVTVETKPPYGTTFKITVPLVFGTINGLLVRAEDQVFILGTANIDRVIRIDPRDIKLIQEREWLTIESKTIPYGHLGKTLQLQSMPKNENPEKITVLLVSQANESVAFGVEEVLSVQEVLVKPLKKPLRHVRNILGVSTLASGRIVPILHVQDLLNAIKQTKAPLPPSIGPWPKESQHLKSEKKILLAEDSMTSRMLLKGILETAGYTVKTAVDGIEAITLLRMEDFDLIISDIEMPRMNGFDLTSEIRKDRQLAEKPVILVSALSSREDLEHGIDVGANAYIVKSSFEQSNLLDAVRRFI